MRRNSFLIAISAVIVFVLMGAVYLLHRGAEDAAVHDARLDQSIAARASSVRFGEWLNERVVEIRVAAEGLNQGVAPAAVAAALLEAGSPRACGATVYAGDGKILAAAGRGTPSAMPSTAAGDFAQVVETKDRAGPLLRISVAGSGRTVVADFPATLAVASVAGHVAPRAKWSVVATANRTLIYDSRHAGPDLTALRAAEPGCSGCHNDGAAHVSPSRWTEAAASPGDAITASATTHTHGLTLQTVVSSPRSAVIRDVGEDLVLTWLLFAALIGALSVTWLGTYQSYRRRIRAEEAARAWEEKHILQQAALDAEQHYRGIVESSHDAIVITDLAGSVTFANRQAQEIFGESGESFAGLLSHDGEDFASVIRKCAGGQPFTFETNLSAASGERTLSFNVVPYVQHGTPSGVIASGRDLTDLRREEQLLRDSERRLRGMLNDSDTLAVFANVDGRITFCSDSLLRLLGLRSEDVVGRPWLDFVAPADLDRVKRTFTDRLASGVFARQAEYCIVTAGGESRLIHWVRTVLRDEGGTPVGIGSVGQDLTARRLAEERVTRLKDFYQRILDRTVSGVVVTNAHDCPIYVNASFVRIAGIEMSEPFVCPCAAEESKPGGGSKVFDSIPSFRGVYSAARAELRVRGFKALPIVPPGESTRYYDGWMVPLTTDGTFDGMICTVEDVTERIASELELGSLKRQHEDLVRAVPGIVWQADAHTFMFEFVSAYAEQMLGHPLQAWYAPDFWIDHLHPDDRERAVAECAAATTAGTDHVLEYRFLAADGRELWLRDVVSVMVEDGRPVKLQGIIIDITERKAIEDALLESESRFRALFEQSAIGIAVQNAERQALETNVAFREMFGYTGDELSTTNRARAAGASVRTEIRSVFDRLWSGTETSIQEERAFARRGGRQIWCRMTASIIRDEYDSPRMTVALFEDVTERKHAERALEQSRAKYRDLVEITTDWVWETDANGVYTYAGPRVRDILGYEPDQVVGRTPFDFMPPDEAVRIRGEFTFHMERRLPFALMENVNLRADGEPVILESSGVPVCDAEGKFAGYRGIDRDVTAREEFKRAHRRLALAIEQSTEVVLVTDREGRIEYVNPAFERVSGYSRREAIGLTPRILRSGVHSQEFYERLWTQLLAGKPWNGRFVNRRKNGSTYEADASIAPIFTEQGAISGFVAVQRDLTDRIALLERLHRAEELERVGRLISGVAHEVRNPLNAIQAAIMALELDLGEGDRNQDLFVAVRSQVGRLADLMRELLDFSKPLDEGRLMRCRVDVLCGEAIALWRSSHPEQPSGRVAFDAGAGETEIQADPVRMQQVLINLLDNAHQHSPAGLEIVVRTTSSNGDGMVQVIDGGLGIRSEHLSRIFEPFFTTRRGGTGLGLSLVRNIVEQHDGRVVLRPNDPRPGCTAEIVLPVCSTVEENEDAGQLVTR